MIAWGVITRKLRRSWANNPMARRRRSGASIHPRQSRSDRNTLGRDTLLDAGRGRPQRVAHGPRSWGSASISVSGLEERGAVGDPAGPRRDPLGGAPTCSAPHPLSDRRSGHGAPDGADGARSPCRRQRRRRPLLRENRQSSAIGERVRSAPGCLLVNSLRAPRSIRSGASSRLVVGETIPAARPRRIEDEARRDLDQGAF